MPFWYSWISVTFSASRDGCSRQSDDGASLGVVAAGSGVTKLLNTSHVDVGLLRSLPVLDDSDDSPGHQLDGMMKFDGLHSRSSLSHLPQRGDLSSHFV